MKKIILASASPRRKELLTLIGIPFEVRVSEADENIGDYPPAEMVMKLSKIKAEAVYKDNRDRIVIGADTIVYFENKILGKPADKQEAFDVLKAMSGKTHEVYTGVTILSSANTESFYECTKVCFDNLSDEEIMEYIDSGEPMDKAGGYGIQGPFAKHVKGIEGDYFNVMGLPLNQLYNHLKNY